MCVTLKHFISLIGSIWHALQDCYDRCCLHHDMPSAPARDPLGPLPLGHLLKCSAPQFHGLWQSKGVPGISRCFWDWLVLFPGVGYWGSVPVNWVWGPSGFTRVSVRDVVWTASSVPSWPYWEWSAPGGLSLFASVKCRLLKWTLLGRFSPPFLIVKWSLCYKIRVIVDGSCSQFVFVKSKPCLPPKH